MVQTSSVAVELATADLGDSRRSARLGVIIDRMVAQPESSFPEMAGSVGELEALYRFLNNPAVAPEAILEPHIVGSVARSEGRGDVIVAHDTTHFPDRETVTWVIRRRARWDGSGQQKRPGVLGACGARDDAIARGVWVGLRYGTRTGPSKWAKSRRIKDVAPGEPSESLRWLEPCHAMAIRDGSRSGVGLNDCSKR